MKRTLKIRCERAVATDARVWLNDFEISSLLSGLTLIMEVGAVTTVDLRIVGVEVDIDAESMAALEAHVKAAP